MQYWLIVISPENFRQEKEILGFKTLGLPHRFRRIVMKMQPGDKVVYYIKSKLKFGATATITGTYYNDNNKLWTNEDRLWSARCPSEPNFVLNDDEMIDVKKFIKYFAFIQRKKSWGVYFQGSIRQISEEEFKLIEDEIKRKILERSF